VSAATLLTTDHEEALRRFWSYPCSFGFEYHGTMTEDRMREVLGLPEHLDLTDSTGAPVLEDGARRSSPRPSATMGCTVVIDSRGQAVGCSILVNGIELASVVRDVDIRLSAGELPKVYLDVVPLEGFKAVLEDAGVHVSFEDPPGAPGANPQ